MALFAASFGTNVSTPLLLLYQERLGLSPWTVTALFAVYPVGLASALLWGGPASDAWGRRRLMVTMVVTSGLTSLLFVIGAANLSILFLARLLLGAVSGIAFVVASAWMQELAEAGNRLWAARLTGMMMYLGFGTGPLVAGVLGEWGPWPLASPYLVHIALIAGGLAAVYRVPETWPGSPAIPVRPHLRLHPHARRPFRRVVTPTAMAVFGFLSLAVGLFPVLLQPAMAEIAVFVTGSVAALASLSIFATQRLIVFLGPLRAAPIALASGTMGSALGTVAFATGAWPILLPASILLGAASGLAVTAGLRFVDMLAQPDSRGTMATSFYAVAYAAMTMPVLVSSLAALANFGLVLAGITALGAFGTGWLVWAIRDSDLLAETQPVLDTVE